MKDLTEGKLQKDLASIEKYHKDHPEGNTPTNNEENLINQELHNREMASKPIFTTQDTEKGWEEEFVRKFFVYKLKDDGQKDHVGAQHDAVAFIQSLISQTKEDLLRDMQNSLMDGATPIPYVFQTMSMMSKFIDEYAKSKGISLDSPHREE